MEQRREGKDVVGAVGGVEPPGRRFHRRLPCRSPCRRPGHRSADRLLADFVDPDKCAAIAQSQIARGAGTVFNVAGLCGLGTLRAAKAGGVWGIGVDADQSGLGAFILTSVVKGYNAGLAELFRQARDGTIRTGVTTVLGLRQGGAGLGRISPKVPASLRAGLARVRARIIAGAIHVPLAPRQ